MKTCIVLEINDRKAIVLFEGGEIKEVKAKKGWQTGQTVSAETGGKKIRQLFVAVACVMLMLVTVGPLAASYMGSDPASDAVSENNENLNLIAVGDPSVIRSTVEKADDDYENVIALLDGETDLRSTAVESRALSPTPVKEQTEPLGLYDSESDTTMDKGGSAAPDHSETNIQVEGIQEADIVKTDGEYIYALNSENLIILKANEGDPKIISKIKQNKTNSQYFEMYVEGDRIAAIRNSTKTVYEDDEVQSLSTSTNVDIFDISDPKDPNKIKTLSQSGEYTDSRMKDGYLYLISEYYPSRFLMDKSMPETYLPEFDNGSVSAAPKAEDIVICPSNSDPVYTVIGSVNVKDPKDFSDRKSILGNTGVVYVSTDNIYMTTWSEEYITTTAKGITAETDTTQLTKLSYGKGKLGAAKTAVIPGVVNGQFFMDEYEGTFRVVTEAYWYGTARKAPSDLFYEKEELSDGRYVYYVSGTYTALFTLDEDLNELGKITNIAPGESLYSCRFMDDHAYFVTFRQVDPLFTADLSDPENPKLAGKLKIPGFSEYMHPYDDGLLLGLGSDADENTGKVGDIKLSMFDNSDPENIKEKHTLIVKGYDNTEAADNHKAILVDSDKKIIAFPSGGTYLVYTYDEKKGFKQIAKISYSDNYDHGGSNDRYYENMIRGMFIKDVFYTITPNTVRAFDLKNDFESISKLKINTGAEPVDKYYYYDGYIE